MIGGDILTIGDRIRALRKEKGLTQKELAQKLGVSASMVGQYETNVRKPKLETLEKFASSLGVSITEIVDISDVSPSLNAAIPLFLKCKDITKKSPPGENIILSDEERSQIRQLAELMGNVSEELSNDSYIANMLRTEYISLFDKLNLRGKYLAVKMISDLANDPDNAGCPFCNRK